MLSRRTFGQYLGALAALPWVVRADAEPKPTIPSAPPIALPEIGPDGGYLVPKEYVESIRQWFDFYGCNEWAQAAGHTVEVK